MDGIVIQGQLWHGMLGHIGQPCSENTSVHRDEILGMCTDNWFRPFTLTFILPNTLPQMVSKALTVGFPSHLSVWFMHFAPHDPPNAREVAHVPPLAAQKTNVTLIERDTSSLRSIEPKHDFVRKIGGKGLMIVKAIDHQENGRPYESREK